MNAAQMLDERMKLALRQSIKEAAEKGDTKRVKRLTALLAEVEISAPTETELRAAWGDR